jgi:hypothetical protein
VDAWIENASRSVDRMRQWLGDAGGFSGDPASLRPTLTADDFKLAFALALERHGLRLQETRNSANQFVPGVYHFRLPDAFRDPVFRPERTCHVVFDREVFQRVRDEDLGRVRGQPIRPVLAGFGEPVTDWLFQTAFEATDGEACAVVGSPAVWAPGDGWILVFALRWMGSARRLLAPDQLAAVFVGAGREPELLTPAQLAGLVREGGPGDPAAVGKPPESAFAAAKRCAQERLKDMIRRVDPKAGSSAGLTLLLVIAVTPRSTQDASLPAA